MHDNAILQITKDISLEKDILYLIIFKNFFALAIPGFIFMLIYALIVAKSLLKPIVQINKNYQIWMKIHYLKLIKKIYQKSF